MLFYIPDALVPARFKGAERRFWNECASLAVLCTAGVIYANITDHPEMGLLNFPAMEKIRLYLHGIPMCPLCGGTRSFLYMCRGEISTALHYSFFGVYFFIAAVFHCLLKFLLLHSPRKSLLKIACYADRTSIFLIMLFSLWGLQLLLHYSGIFSWFALAGR